MKLLIAGDTVPTPSNYSLFQSADMNALVGKEIMSMIAQFDFFSLDWEHMPFNNGHPNSKGIINKPTSLDKMIELAGILSKDIPHVRVDFYDIKGQILFGELTLSHWSGMMPFKPEEWDLRFGEWIQIPKK